MEPNIENNICSQNNNTIISSILSTDILYKKFPPDINNPGLLNQSLKTLNHDIRNILFSIYGYISIGQYKKAQQKINEICHIIPKAELKKITGDICIDNLISSKICIANSYSIKFVYFSNIDNHIFIERSELCTLIGNALDNSIEACLKIPDTQKRKIKIDISSIQNHISINVGYSVNSYVDTSFKTSKTDSKNHGIGMQSIKSIVRKYKGSFNVSQKNNFFSLNIRIPNLNTEQYI